MSGMFVLARDFNRPLNSWNVSNVTDMRGMFDYGDLSSAFNQPLNNWDVSNVTDMREMFRGAENFNQNLSGWCVTNITSEPFQFSTGSALTNANKPVWGTCP
jgi:surface protein